jgi:ATP-dependent Clp protease protease subunit
VRRIKKFWNWVKNETGRSLYLDGYIAPESWFEDEVSPKEFKRELEAGTGDITVWINSPGGDFFAASQIYTMLKEYPGEVLVKIDGIAASAAAVIAMAGDLVLMSPTAMLMIHNPATFVWGDPPFRSPHRPCPKLIPIPTTDHRRKVPGCPPPG